MAIEGGCQCGQVRYRLKGPLGKAYACHCGVCRKQTGSAFSLAAPVVFEDMELVGELHTVSWDTPSGAVGTGYFCPGCGSRVFHRSSRSPHGAMLRAGSLDDPSGVVPACHLWVSRKLPWVALDPDVPAYDEQPAVL
jgi:hypothetical protein